MFRSRLRSRVALGLWSTAIVTVRPVRTYVTGTRCGWSPSTVASRATRAPASRRSASASGNRTGRGLDQLVGGAGDVQDHTGLIRVERLQVGDLRLQQRGRHEVALPGLEPRADHVSATGQVHEEHRTAAPQQVTVRALERRASHDTAVDLVLPDPGRDGP